jgi:hypothetical protein
LEKIITPNEIWTMMVILAEIKQLEQGRAGLLFMVDRLVHAEPPCFALTCAGLSLMDGYFTRLDRKKQTGT